MEKATEFKSAKAWETWLAKNHTVSNGVWLRMFKKNPRTTYLKGSDALDVALCYGWITGQARPYDGLSVLWRFTPRRPRSMWSKINTGHAERLIKERRMKPAGLKQIAEAKLDGRWERAYNPPSTAKLPQDFLKEVSKNKKAREFLATLNKSRTYSIIFRLETARTAEIRKEKIKSIIRMLEQGKTFH